MKGGERTKVLAVIVNYGEEQLKYLEQMVNLLSGFKKYEVDIIVHSNIILNLRGVKEFKVIKLKDYRFLPSTCRQTIWEKRNNYDLFFYSENDLMIKEHHFDKFLLYTRILPENRIPGLIRFEKKSDIRLYPDYHGDFGWKLNSTEKYGGKVFAHFTNLHQASFILTKNQLQRVASRLEFTTLVEDKVPISYKIKRKFRNLLGLRTRKYLIYDVLCKTGTDIYQYGGFRKVICISELEDNLIHHMSDMYVRGGLKSNKIKSTDEVGMQKALKNLGQC